MRGLIAFGMIGALLQAFAVVHAATPSDNGNLSSRSKKSFTNDSGVVVIPSGIAKIILTTAGQGDTAHGVEVTRSRSQANNGLSRLALFKLAALFGGL